MVEGLAPGAPVSGNGIPLCVPEICGNEWQYIKECLDTNWVSSVGSFVDRFERMVADYVGTKYAVATVSGTAALHVALLVSGVQPDDEVLVSTLTFIAPANAIRYVGAWPIFIDAEPDYWQMDPQKAVDFLEKECRWRESALYNKTTGRRIKAILPVHVLGHPVVMDPILEMARKYNLVVIEDAAEGLGTKFLTIDDRRQTSGWEQQSHVNPANSDRSGSIVTGQSLDGAEVNQRWSAVGSLGDIGCLSFNGNKIITTGGGGMLVTDSKQWADRARHLSTQAKDDPIEYIHSEVGYNYRLTNLQAAMGCAQMEQLDGFVRSKRRIAELYAQTLAEIPGLTTPDEAPWACSTFWLYTILIDEMQYGLNARALLHQLAKMQIQARPLWQPLHMSAVFANCQATDCSVAEALNRNALSLPCSVGLAEEDQRRVCSEIAADRGS